MTKNTTANGATTENFEPKFMLFLEKSDQEDILDEDRKRNLLIMLMVHACKFYFDFLHLQDLCLVELEVLV